MMHLDGKNKITTTTTIIITIIIIIIMELTRDNGCRFSIEIFSSVSLQCAACECEMLRITSYSSRCRVSVAASSSRLCCNSDRLDILTGWSSKLSDLLGTRPYRTAAKS